MSSFWHANVLGRYDHADKWIGLDYGKLFLDPSAAEMTHIHEVVHSVLSRSTDFGQATEAIFKQIQFIKGLSPEEKEKIKHALYTAQLVTQETTATLAEISHLRRIVGPKEARLWAEKNLPLDYLERFRKVDFVLDLSQRYRDEFMKKIAHLALHTSIRIAIVTDKLLASSDVILEYLRDVDNNPDIRFKRLIDACRAKPYLPTRPVEEIAQIAGIKLFPDVTKNDAANFLNHLLVKSGWKERFKANDIRDANGINFMSEANSQIIIANMNLNLAETAEYLFNKKDVSFYSDKTEAIMVNVLGEEIDYKKELELLSGRKLEAGMILFLRDRTKYLSSFSFKETAEMISQEFAGSTLIVKWGLYQPNASGFKIVGGTRNPDVVIFNDTSTLDEYMRRSFVSSEKVHRLHVGASENHPFATLYLLDKNNVLYMTNGFPKQIEELLDKHKDKFHPVDVEVFRPVSRHLNNSLSVWNNLDWDIDWYETMVNGKTVVARK